MHRILSILSASLLVMFLGCQDHITAPDAPEDASAIAPGDAAFARPDHAPAGTFVAPLSGREEVPAVATRATGVATFKLNNAGTELSYRLNVANIEGVTQSHIHCGAAGENGPVVAFLFGFEEDGVSLSGRLAEGTITASDVIPRESSDACPGGIADFEDLIEQMRAGQTYVNVHTLEHPPGEIRGQIDRGSAVARR